MSLTAQSSELEITPGSSPNTHLALAGWCSRGSPISSFFEKPPLVRKSLPWPTDVAALAIGGIGLNDAGAFLLSNPESGVQPKRIEPAHEQRYVCGGSAPSATEPVRGSLPVLEKVVQRKQLLALDFHGLRILPGESVAPQK